MTAAAIAFMALGRTIVPARGGSPSTSPSSLRECSVSHPPCRNSEHAFSMRRVFPRKSCPFKAAIAASASAGLSMVTKPNPRDSLVWGSRMT